MNSEEKLLDIVIKLTKTKKLIWYINNKFLAKAVLGGRVEFTLGTPIDSLSGLNVFGSDYYKLTIKHGQEETHIWKKGKNNKLFELYTIVFIDEQKNINEMFIAEFSKFL
ncbi:hypothetical protein M0R19_05800 [Candidatus Pacearchaeota archaeon]|jgi:hypothetical protein|nr:hypothetical protein [Candidatus Pacearchaeota archaeon]